MKNSTQGRRRREIRQNKGTATVGQPLAGQIPDSLLKPKKINIRLCNSFSPCAGIIGSKTVVWHAAFLDFTNSTQLLR